MIHPRPRFCFIKAETGTSLYKHVRQTIDLARVIYT
jgi:hypothetical protein